MKILLVEDNPVDQKVIRLSLNRVEGFEFELNLCTSLAEAVASLDALPFDVILLDLWLPDSEGLATCRRLVDASHGIPVVVMTASDDRELATQAMRGGAQEYLVKGTHSGSDIVRVLQYAIDRQHFHRDMARLDNHFRQVLDHVPATIWTTDRAHRITSVLGAGLRSLNIDPEQVIGKSLKEFCLVTGKANGAVEEHCRVLTGESVAFETQWMTRIFEVKIDPLFEPTSENSGTIGVALDVTERRGLNREIGFARRVQEALLPAEHPHLYGFDIFGGSLPAKLTCGDWFDYLQLADGSWGLAVGDVSGKGFGPAILSATIAAYLEVLAETHTDIREIMSLCNRLVCKRTCDGHFAVLSLARLVPGAESVTFCGAGDGALVVNHDGMLKATVSANGLPIGLIGDAIYSVPTQVLLETGDILLMLTDGFREARNPDGELFLESQIVETVAAHVDDSAQEIFTAVWQAARTFASSSPQQDDMTGIVVKLLA